MYGVPFISVPLKAARVPYKSHRLAYHNFKNRWCRVLKICSCSVLRHAPTLSSSEQHCSLHRALLCLLLVALRVLLPMSMPDLDDAVYTRLNGQRENARAPSIIQGRSYLYLVQSRPSTMNQTLNQVGVIVKMADIPSHVCVTLVSVG